ncbi:MAG: hypothetical protein PHF00_09520, partial [Elusimicrobia bacterium]|nr:hypothetical protein [Elusimicrobiota bacterium]
AATGADWRRGGLWRLRPRRPAAPDAFFGGLFLAFWFYWFRYDFVPETSFDALEYHLGLPQLYLLAGRIFPTPENSYSGIPNLPSMIYGWTLALDPSGILAGMLHGCATLGIAAAFMGLSRRLGRPRAGPLAAALFITTPVVMIESIRISVGLEWAMLELAALTAFLAMLERPAWAWPAGALLGMAMASKYPAWLLPLAYAAAWWALRRRRDAELRAPPPRSWAVFSASALAVVLPWALKNWIFYGNPLYPAGQGWLRPADFYLPDWGVLAQGRNLASFLTAGGWKAYLLHPLSFLRPPGDLGESVGPAYAALAPLLWLGAPSTVGFVSAMFFLGAWLPLSLLHSLTRYFIPHLALLCCLLAAALTGVRGDGSRRGLAALAAALVALTGGGCILLDAHSRAKLDLLARRQGRAEFLAHGFPSYPAPPYAGFEFINANAPPGAKVLLFGESRSFHLRRLALAGSPDQPQILVAWANASADSAQLWRRFESAGVAYVLVNHGEIARRAMALRFTARGKAALDAFWSRWMSREFAVREWPDRWVEVYRRMSPEEAARPHPAQDLFAAYATAAGR